MNMKRINSNTPIAIKLTVSVPFHPTVSALEMPYTNEIKPKVAVIAPGTSYLVSPVARDSFTYFTASNTAMMAIGMLTNKVQCQEVYSTRIPPMINPIAAPPPERAPYTPKAFARSLLSVKVTVINERAAGASRAAKTPCSPRAEINNPWLVATPPSADAVAKPMSPMMSMRLRPA
ncbi:unannotated protein [freshwater metagenome]|uniref:Unannotated protein n=1 Tax=freshwater metagenome TaxID=449393 RepID=A0A6J6LE67_9ZZZZ